MKFAPMSQVLPVSATFFQNVPPRYKHQTTSNRPSVSSALTGLAWGKSRLGNTKLHGDISGKSALALQSNISEVCRGDRHGCFCQREWGDHVRGQVGKRLQNTELRPSTALLFTALAAVGQRGSVVWTELCKPMPGPMLAAQASVGTAGSSESETQPGFNVSENHQNQHVKTILAAQSFTNSWKNYCTRYQEWGPCQAAHWEPQLAIRLMTWVLEYLRASCQPTHMWGNGGG